MKQKLNKAVSTVTDAEKKIRGKKTEGMGVLMVAFQILMVLKPDLITPDVEKAINIAISSGAVTAIGHRIWRNRKIVTGFVAETIKRLKNGSKEQNRERDGVSNDIQPKAKNTVQKDKINNK